MDLNLIELATGGAGGAVLVVAAYLKIIASRLDAIQSGVEKVSQQVDDLDRAVRDHEVRIQVIERLQMRGDDEAQAR